MLRRIRNRCVEIEMLRICLGGRMHWTDFVYIFTGRVL